MMDSRLLLPGSIEGLLARGSPVVIIAGPWAHLYPGMSGFWLPCGVGPSLVAFGTEADQGWGLAAFRDPADVALDLRDPAGVDRAARWVAEKLGMDVPTTAPAWVRGHERVQAWALQHVNGGMIGFDTIGGRGPWGGSMLTYTIIPALASIDLADPLADSLALAAVVRHLAGAP